MYLFYLSYSYDALVNRKAIGLMQCQHCLSSAEKHRISAYKCQKTAVQQILSYGLRRLVLAILMQKGSHANRAGEESLAEHVIKIDETTLRLAISLNLWRNSHGKPYLEPLLQIPELPRSYAFSISHCEDFICILVGNDQANLGVDVEPLKKFNYQSMMGVMHLCEQQKIQNARDFLFYWTRKEAYLKALGVGLVDELAQINTVDLQVIDERAGAKQGLAADKPFYCHGVDLHPEQLIHVCHGQPKQALQLINLQQLFA